jgi:hypothetical protein
MRRRGILLILTVVLLGAPGMAARADVATSPAGVTSQPASSLPQAVLQRARAFRGNPIPLAVVTGVALLVAAGLGLYTIVLVYREPDRRSPASPPTP